MAADLVPLTVAAPLVAAALLAALAQFLPRWVPDLTAIVVAAGVTALGVLLTLASRAHPIVYWFGGWRPAGGTALGIDFVVEPLSASLVALTGLLTTTSLVFSWRYFEEVGHLYHALVLALLAGMAGFALSGDLFNIFVWFELMSVSAYALCGYQIHQSAVVQGAINFTVVNSTGAFTLLLGIVLVYGRTGALNLAEIGEALGSRPPDGLVTVAFTLITTGLLVKAGAVPFHFWLSDAYAVAPAPVGALFTGIMSDLAYHTFARVYWDGFSGALGSASAAVRDGLLALGVASAVIGAVMCLLQADLKRQLAFLTVSHGGVFLAGIALLTPRGLAGATLFVITDGLLKAALFLTFATVVRSLGSGDELALHGRGRTPREALPALIFLCCALGFAALPPFGTFLSAALIHDSPGPGWPFPVLAACLAVTSAAFLRAGARIFLGWGPRHDPLLTSAPGKPGEPGEPGDGEPDHGGGGAARGRTALLIPALALVAAAYATAFVPGVAAEFITASHSFEQPRQTAHQVLTGHLPPSPPSASYTPTPGAWTTAAAATAAALALAAVSLRTPGSRPGRLRRVLVPPAKALKSLHDGEVGDYTLWFTTGLLALGLAWTLTLR
ncbi:complex I subunit 5 family protein [Streptomyces triticisoli]|uniref:complex I subunit 5 family protein n=1 Tax=Streptomyces triticisoli TaxID=2182797 RepID=UPI000DD52C45|nr:complex I subunit 5 family protein [Streptomyces triticisoli]